MSGTDSSEHFLSLVDLLKYFGVERGLLVDRLQEIDYLEACMFIFWPETVGIETFGENQ